jgi:hypothetical protein
VRQFDSCLEFLLTYSSISFSQILLSISSAAFASLDGFGITNCFSCCRLRRMLAPYVYLVPMYTAISFIVTAYCLACLPSTQSKMCPEACFGVCSRSGGASVVVTNRFFRWLANRLLNLGSLHRKMRERYFLFNADSTAFK